MLGLFNKQNINYYFYTHVFLNTIFTISEKNIRSRYSPLCCKTLDFYGAQKCENASAKVKFIVKKLNGNFILNHIPYKTNIKRKFKASENAFPVFYYLIDQLVKYKV